jgi:tetraacyldisaccharide 4'-kinase
VGVPVISVGNITVGGTGKTPLVEFLGRFLLEDGVRVGVVSSGYGRASRAAVLEPGYRLHEKGADEVGDEVLLLARSLPEAIFSVARSKAEAARRLAATGEVDAILVDDGFQHFALRRDVDIVAYDAAVKKRALKRFPYGVLREPLSALRRADVVIVTRSNFAKDIGLLQKRLARLAPQAEMYTAQFMASEVLDDERRLPVKYLEDKSVFLFAGVGNFRSLRKQVAKLCADLDFALELSDHQVYDRFLLERIKRRAAVLGSDVILTTGKDWVKLPGFAFDREIYYLGQTVDLDPGEEKLVKNLEDRLGIEGRRK